MSDTKKAITELQRLIEPQDAPESTKVPSPEMDEVLYVTPAPGGEHRKCSNCTLWQSEAERCAIHENSVTVTADHVCGYHLLGAPSGQWKNVKGLQLVTPQLSGLIQVKGGTACENCNHFTKVEEEDGVCAAVYKKKRPAHVHPKGCCTRWVRREPAVDPKAGK